MRAGTNPKVCQGSQAVPVQLMLYPEVIVPEFLLGYLTAQKYIPRVEVIVTDIQQLRDAYQCGGDLEKKTEPVCLYSKDLWRRRLERTVKSFQIKAQRDFIWAKACSLDSVMKTEIWRVPFKDQQALEDAHDMFSESQPAACIICGSIHLLDNRTSATSEDCPVVPLANLYTFISLFPCKEALSSPFHYFILAFISLQASAMTQQMSTPLRDFCVAWRGLKQLQDASRLKNREAVLTKNAAQSVLQDYMLSSGISTAIGYTASVDGATYRVRLRPAKVQSPKSTSSSSVDKLLKLWEDPSALEERLSQDVGLDPVAALVSLVLESMSEAAAAAATDPKLRLEVLPYKCKDGGADAPPIPPEGAPVNDLVSTIVTIRDRTLRSGKEDREVRKTLEEKRDTAAEEVLPELQSLPSEKKVQKLNLHDAEGNCEAFYLRLKAPAKIQFKKVTATIYKKLLKSTAEETINRFCITAFNAPSALSRREFGESLCEALKTHLKELEITPNPGKSGPRIALDRVRARSSAAPKQSN